MQMMGIPWPGAKFNSFFIPYMHDDIRVEYAHKSRIQAASTQRLMSQGTISKRRSNMDNRGCGVSDRGKITRMKTKKEI
jgi:hypothetical protein